MGKSRVNQPEAQRASFIIRIWLEETAAETGLTTWRGSITHVQSGEKQYFEGLDAIAEFIMSYLKELGVPSLRTSPTSRGSTCAAKEVD